jgi:hypothetical protein
MLEGPKTHPLCVKDLQDLVEMTSGLAGVRHFNAYKYENRGSVALLGVSMIASCARLKKESK